jgi:hypothetical protein
MEETMSTGEVIVLAFIIGAFVIFGATLGWLSRH